MVKRPLTPEGFGKFLRWLSDDDELAVREYQVIRRKLIAHFTRKNCADPDALFDETIDIVVGKIDECEKIANPLAYCYGVAKNVWRQHRRKLRTIAIESELVSPEREPPVASEEELECLESCINGLPEVEREIVRRYHEGRGRERIEARKCLAEGFSGMNALRIKVCRICKDVRLCVGDCVEKSTRGELA